MFRHAEPRHTRSQRLQPGVFHVITRCSRLFLFTIISARTETSVGPRSSVLGPARPGEAMADLCTKAKKAIQAYIDKADNGNCWGQFLMIFGPECLFLGFVWTSSGLGHALLEWA